ncbi:MAG: hypothetical protein ACYSWO_23365 [Planctomycetota bacterium]|jgi:hypothetical protein
MSKPLSSLSRSASLRAGSELVEGTFAGFFTGIPNVYSASPDFGAPLDYVRAGSSCLNEVEPPEVPTNFSPAELSRQSSRISLAFRCLLILFTFPLFH